MIPMEWFQTIAQIILEQLKHASIGDCKKDSFTTGNDLWSLGSLQSVEDHIKEIEILREVALMAAFLHEQAEDFSKSPLTQESIKSQRKMLFSRNCKGDNYLKGVIRHDLQLQVAEQIANTGDDLKALQHYETTINTEALAEELTEKILKQMNYIVDKEINLVVDELNVRKLSYLKNMMSF